MDNARLRTLLIGVFSVLFMLSLIGIVVLN